MGVSSVLSDVPVRGFVRVGIQFAIQCCWTHSVSLTRASKGVLSCEGMLSAWRSKASARYGNCREAARPVPSMPGRYTMRGRSSWVALGARPGMYGLMKRGGPPARHTAVPWQQIQMCEA